MSCVVKSNFLPRDMVFTVFGFCSPEELAKHGRVCRKWRECASDEALWNAYDLKKLYPGFNDLRGIWDRIGPACGLSAEGAPHLSNRILIPVVSRMSRFVEGGAGVTVFIVPKGCSLNKILHVAEDHGIPAGYRWLDAIRALGEIQTSAAKVVVMTNSVFANSRNRSVMEQQAMVERIGYNMPDVVSAVSLLVLTFMSSATARVRLYNDTPWTYTRCQEEVDSGRLIVGGFALFGFAVNFTFCNRANFGVGALKILE